MRPQVDCGKFCIRHGRAAFVDVLVQRASHDESLLGCRGADESNDGLIVDQRLATPVLADERKQSVLDAVPLAGAGREVADRDFKARVVGEFL